jgi:hypothetical protein
MNKIPKELKYEHSELLNTRNYNAGVYTCDKCFHKNILLFKQGKKLKKADQSELYYKKGLLGFCKAPIYNSGGMVYAHVWECQECFNMWWHHVSWDSIKMSIRELEEKWDTQN